MMSRIAKWLIAWLLIVSIAMPRVAYACTLPPAHWEVTISGLQSYNYDLPDGLNLRVSDNSIKIANRTEQRVTLGGLTLSNYIIRAHSSLQITKRDLYHTLFPSSYSDGSEPVYYSIDDYFQDEAAGPPLTGEIELSLRHDGQLYKVPITAYYDIRYIPPGDGLGCGLGPAIALLALMIVALMIGIILIVWTVKGRKKRQHSRSTEA